MSRALLYAVLFAVAGAFLLPLIWMVSTSLKPVEQTMTTTPSFVPEVTPAVVLRQLEADRAMMVLETPGETSTLADLDARIELWQGLVEADAERERETRALARLVNTEGTPEAEIESARERIAALDARIDEGMDDAATIPALYQLFEDNYFGRTGPDGEIVVRGVLNDPVIDFALYLRNTLIIASLSIVGMVLSSALVAYGFARVKWRGRGVVFTLVLATMMIPFPVLMGPLFVIFRELGWIGSLKPLWVPAWFGSAFNIFLLRQFYMSIPSELDEAARIDGCSHWGIFWRIIVPLSKPALAVVALFHFLFVWNDFLGPLIFLRDRDQFTLALGLQLYQSQAGNVPWNLLMAASTLVLLPVLIVFLLAQRAFVEGIATSGLKE